MWWNKCSVARKARTIAATKSRVENSQQIMVTVKTVRIEISTGQLETNFARNSDEQDAQYMIYERNDLLKTIEMNEIRRATP